MKNKFFKNFLTILVSTLISLVAAELIFRWMLFSDNKSFQRLRNPGMYANELYEDYWKLYYRFGGSSKPPKNPQPVLGWIGSFNRDSYEHNDINNVGNKRPVLLYGDSFAQCVDSVECFQDILNNDSSFNKKYHLLNYGVGGYGVDQIYLLCSLTVKKFVNPFVVFSIMPTDMDRCVLSVRTGQKPYFADEGGQLVLKGVPINPDPAEFFKQHPPSITSYMAARFLHSDLNRFINTRKGDDEVRKKIRELNEKIILKADSELKSLGIDYTFMIYDNVYSEDGNWRVDFLTSFFNKHKISFIYTTELLYHDPDFSEFSFDHYIIKGEGHPTSHYNRLVSEEIKNYLFDFKNYSNQKMIDHMLLGDSTGVAYYERRIRLDKDWLKSVKEKAEKRNISLDSMVHLDAMWLVDEEKKKIK